MTPDQITDCMRWTLREALIISAPVLVVATVTSLLLSLVQTLTSIQDQTLSTIPRLLVVIAAILAGLPWFLHRLMFFTVGLLGDFRRFLG